MAVTSLLSFTLSAGMVALSPLLSGISVGSLDVQPLSPFSSVTVCLPPFSSSKVTSTVSPLLASPGSSTETEPSSSAFNTGADGATVSTAKSAGCPWPLVLPAGSVISAVTEYWPSAVTLSAGMVTSALPAVTSSAVSVCSTVSVVPSGLVTVSVRVSPAALPFGTVTSVCTPSFSSSAFTPSAASGMATTGVASVAPSPSVSPGIWVSAVKSTTFPGFAGLLP